MLHNTRSALLIYALKTQRNLNRKQHDRRHFFWIKTNGRCSQHGRIQHRMVGTRKKLHALHASQATPPKQRRVGNLCSAPTANCRRAQHQPLATRARKRPKTAIPGQQVPRGNPDTRRKALTCGSGNCCANPMQPRKLPILSSLWWTSKLSNSSSRRRRSKPTMRKRNSTKPERSYKGDCDLRRCAASGGPASICATTSGPGKRTL